MHEYACQASARERKKKVRRARSLIALYRHRAELTDFGLFHDPAWILMLNLYVSNFVGQRFSITDAANIAMVPPTTAVRYVQNLHDRGLVEQCRADDGTKMAELKLTQEGYDLVSGLLAQML